MPPVYISRMDGTALRPSVPSLLDEDGMTAGDYRGRRKHRYRPASTVLGRHQAFRCSIWLEVSELMVLEVSELMVRDRVRST